MPLCHNEVPLYLRYDRVYLVLIYSFHLFADLILFLLIYFLFESTVRGREGGREKHFLLGHFPNGLNGEYFAKIKPGDEP